jgi:hypothetical protein
MQILTALSSHLYFLRPGFGPHGRLIQDLFETCSAFFGAFPVKPEQFPNKSRTNLERCPKPPSTTPEEIVVNSIVLLEHNLCCSGMCRYSAGFMSIFVRRLFGFLRKRPGFLSAYPNNTRTKSTAIPGQYRGDMGAICIKA